MKAYKLSMAIIVIIGLVVVHAFVACLIVFFIYRYLIMQNDPGMYLLIGFFVLDMCAMDILAYRAGVFRKLFLKIRTTEKGITCYGFLVQKYEIAWSDVQSYGVASKMFAYPMIFISVEAEKNTKLAFQFEKYSKKRITMQVLDGTWEELSRYMPLDMKRNMGNALRTHSDRRFFR